MKLELNAFLKLRFTPGQPPGPGVGWAPQGGTWCRKSVAHSDTPQLMRPAEYGGVPAPPPFAPCVSANTPTVMTGNEADQPSESSPCILNSVQHVDNPQMSQVPPPDSVLPTTFETSAEAKQESVVCQIISNDYGYAMNYVIIFRRLMTSTSRYHQRNYQRSHKGKVCAPGGTSHFMDDIHTKLANISLL